MYAIVFAVEGAPMVYFEDLFNIGYDSNRYGHIPTDTLDLPMRSDLVNIIWCRQNLHFADGSYLIRWQENDALVLNEGKRFPSNEPCSSPTFEESKNFFNEDLNGLFIEQKHFGHQVIKGQNQIVQK